MAKVQMTKKELEAAAAKTISEIDNFVDAVEAVKKLKLSSKTQRGYYITFGRIWLQVREKTNGNKRIMGLIRKTQFSDAKGQPVMDEYTMSDAAKLAADWETGLNYKDWADKHAPYVNNPRVILRKYREWAKENTPEGKKAVKEAAEKLAEKLAKEEESKKAAEKAANEKKHADFVRLQDLRKREEAVKESTARLKKREQELKLVKPNPPTSEGLNEKRPAPVNLSGQVLRSLSAAATAINKGEFNRDELVELTKQLQITMKAVKRAFNNAPMTELEISRKKRA